MQASLTLPSKWNEPRWKCLMKITENCWIAKNVWCACVSVVVSGDKNLTFVEKLRDWVSQLLTPNQCDRSLCVTQNKMPHHGLVLSHCKDCSAQVCKGVFPHEPNSFWIAMSG